MDTCGFPKDNFYYYQAWWGDKPVLHLFPHWNWAGKEGQEIDVRAFSNFEEVELLLNGTSLGKQKMPTNSHVAVEGEVRAGDARGQGIQGTEVSRRRRRSKRPRRRSESSSSPIAPPSTPTARTWPSSPSPSSMAKGGSCPSPTTRFNSI